MTQEQVMILIRDLLKVGGTVAAILGATQGNIDQWTNIILMVAGPLATLGAVFWSQARHTVSGIVSQASRLDEVTEITVTKPELAVAAKEADKSTQVIVKPKPAF